MATSNLPLMRVESQVGGPKHGGLYEDVQSIRCPTCIVCLRCMSNTELRSIAILTIARARKVVLCMRCRTVERLHLSHESQRSQDSSGRERL